MRAAAPALVVLLGSILPAAGCAATGSGRQESRDFSAALDALSGVPDGVLVGKAALELSCGDPAREARARCVLRAAPAGALEEWRARAMAAPEGSAARLDCLGILADRGDPLQDVSPEETVAACLRAVARSGGNPRDRILVSARLLRLGEAAGAPLRAAAAAGGPEGDCAARVLRSLGLAERDLPGVRP